MSFSDETLFNHHAKTFSLAAKLFRSDDRYNITVFYAFCRTMDDVVDLSRSTHCSLEILNRVRGELHDGHLSSFPKMEALMREKSIPSYFLIRLIDALEDDLYPRSIKSVDELLTYAQGVASTVGVILCKTFGMRDKSAIPFAVDLGIAMQLTNIVRDVYEDAVNKHLYLPHELFDNGYLTNQIDQDTQKVVDNYQSAEISHVREKVLSIAADYYRSAEKGLKFLPIPARYAITAAASMYEEIGNSCRSDWSIKRARVSSSQKIWSSIKGISRSLLTGYRAPLHPVNSEFFYKEMIDHYGTV
ncbi:MAG: phytoene/squalene synthase family protein [Chlamydiota bacterium]